MGAAAEFGRRHHRAAARASNATGDRRQAVPRHDLRADPRRHGVAEPRGRRRMAALAAFGRRFSLQSHAALGIGQFSVRARRGAVRRRAMARSREPPHLATDIGVRAGRAALLLQPHCRAWFVRPDRLRNGGAADARRMAKGAMDRAGPPCGAVFGAISDTGRHRCVLVAPVRRRSDCLSGLGAEDVPAVRRPFTIIRRFSFSLVTAFCWRCWEALHGGGG